jgi:hypothetical protein
LFAVGRHAMVTGKFELLRELGARSGRSINGET